MDIISYYIILDYIILYHIMYIDYIIDHMKAHGRGVKGEGLGRTAHRLRNPRPPAHNIM